MFGNKWSRKHETGVMHYGINHSSISRTKVERIDIPRTEVQRITVPRVGGHYDICDKDGNILDASWIKVRYVLDIIMTESLTEREKQALLKSVGLEDCEIRES